jgi:hypothetical protein
MRVFISYARRDKAKLQRLLSAFQAAHFDVWWDQELSGGASWWRGILEQIRSCDVFVFALSENSLHSKHCLTEFRYAEAVGKRVLPVQIGGVKEIRETPFAAWHVIDYQIPAENTGIRLIEDARRTTSKPLPDPLPPEPPRPYEYLTQMKEELSGPQLIPTDQQQLLFKLKEQLKKEAGDPAARADIAGLLDDLRNRPDTTPEIRAECDAELESLNFRRPGDRRLTRRRVLAGAVLLLAVVTAVVVGSVMLPGRQVTTARLKDVLLAAKDVDTVMGTDMKSGGIVEHTGEIPPGFAPPECIGTLYNGNIAVYKDTGYSDTRNQALKHPAEGSDPDAVVFQSAFLFPSPTRATELVGATAEKWKTCSDRPVTVTEPGDGQVSTWTFGRSDYEGSHLVVNATLSQGPELPYACQKVMRAESMVGIEVLVCRKSAPIGNEAVGIAEKMAGKVADLTAWPRRWFP